jgi:hypothetical protein
MENQIPEPKTNLEITDDLTDTKIILDGLIEAHKNGRKTRERSLVITKLQEARMWVLEAQATE